jgi:ankyrin repeat protein
MDRSAPCRRVLAGPASIWFGLAFLAAGGQANASAELIAAAAAGDTANLSRLLDKGADAESRQVDGSTALHWAVRADQFEAAGLLLQAGADAAASDRYGVQPLFLAAENGSERLVSLLLEAGADAAATAPNGESMLMTAVRTGRRPSIQKLIQYGADVNFADGNFGQTALMLAVREDHPAIVALLIDHGANVDGRTIPGPAPEFVLPCKGTGCGSEGVGINRGGLPDRGRRDPASGGMTPLLYAARDGRPAAAEILLAAGADIELAEANAIRPLLMAVLNNQQAVAYRLLAAGADPSADDFWGRAPLFAAVEYRNLDMNNRELDSPIDNGVDRGPILELIESLIERGANVNARTREVPPRRRWLYSLGDVSWVDFTGQTPFLRAALSGDLPTMNVLLAAGADPSISTLAGTTPLMAASGVNWVVAQTYTVSDRDQLEAVRLCLELGNEINAVNSMGLSALLGAANRGANEIIEFLAANGADLDLIDVEGRSAQRWAEGVFLAAVGAEQKPATIALLERLQRDRGAR